MAKIIVGVDGSPHAQAALQWAVEEARLRGASLTAVYAYTPYSAELYGLPGEQLQTVIDEADNQAEGILSEAVAAVREEAGAIKIDTEVARGESAARALVDRSSDADMLVVGSRGRGGIAGMLLGSVSQQAAQHSPCPVTIIRSD